MEADTPTTPARPDLEEWLRLAERMDAAEMAEFRDNDAVAAARYALHLEGALRVIAARGCQNFTTGLGSCFRNGRTADAEYGADQACEGCIAHAALEGKT